MMKPGDLARVNRSINPWNQLPTAQARDNQQRLLLDTRLAPRDVLLVLAVTNDDDGVYVMVGGWCPQGGWVTGWLEAEFVKEELGEGP